MKKYLCIIFDENWGDEFDVDTLHVMTDTDWERLKELITKNFKPDAEYYFGTNEFVSFSSLDEVFRGLKIKETTKEFYDEFRRLTDSNSYGMMPLERLAEDQSDGWRPNEEFKYEK